MVIKKRGKNNNKIAKPTTTKNIAPAPLYPPPISTTQQQPRKAKSFTSPEDVTIETEIRPTPRILPPGKVIKCFLSIAVGKVTADKPSEEKWSRDVGALQMRLQMVPWLPLCSGWGPRGRGLAGGSAQAGARVCPERCECAMPALGCCQHQVESSLSAFLLTSAAQQLFLALS